MYVEKLYALMEKSPDDANEVVERVNCLTAYVNVVANQEMQQTRNRILLDGGRIDREEYINRIEVLNDKRNTMHDSACKACDVINQIAKRNHQREIFDFELEKMTDARGHVGYSSNNHFVVARFCGELTNELYERGELAREQNILDAVVDKAQKVPYPKISASEMGEVAESLMKSDKTDSIKETLQNEGPCVIICRDGTELSITDVYENGYCDMAVSGKGNKADLLGDAAWYFDDGKGEDIPSNVVVELAQLHGGAVGFKEPEKSLFDRVMAGEDIGQVMSEKTDISNLEH